MKNIIHRINKTKIKQYSIKITISILLISSFVTIVNLFTKNSRLQTTLIAFSKSNINLNSRLSSVQKDFEKLKQDDQYKRNEKLQQDIKNIETNYKNSVSAYEKILDLSASKVKTDKYSQEFAKIINLLSKRNYASAEGTLSQLNKNLDAEKQKLIDAFTISENAVKDNNPPSNGYRRQNVQTDAGSFLVDIISADLNSTRVIVDTASDSTCTDNCPVLSLSDYVGRSGAFAGINGPFFCPASYPSCAGKTNSFDTLLMNKNKVYFNSDNNVYSTVPAVIFSGNSARFVSRSLEWGRDTGVDSVIANFPIYVLNGENIFGGSGESKLNSKGARSFIGTNNNMVYIGFVQNATSAEAAKVLKTLGLQNALGLDQGGSSALWYGGYKMGPGRAIPTAVLFIRK